MDFKMRRMAFSQSPLNRNANSRTDPNILAQKLAHPDRQVLKFSDDKVLMAGTEPDLAATSDNQAVYLGDDEKARPWFAVTVTQGTSLRPIRDLMRNGELPPPLLSIIAQGRSLTNWHARHGFCANCGAKTEMSDSGYRRHCPSCKADHFPRTDPVVIMAVRHGAKILLARQKAWEPGMFSAVAGFMEPGETIEQAVAREVFEETGIVVGKVTYVASQPWPFASSLMIGAIAEAKDTKITMDEVELEHARWFSFAEVRQMLAHKHPDGLTASHPYAIAHHVIEAAITI
jgi:NADH pyrophosphatase NudC (nudix superfamily)